MSTISSPPYYCENVEQVGKITSKTQKIKPESVIIKRDIATGYKVFAYNGVIYKTIAALSSDVDKKNTFSLNVNILMRNEQVLQILNEFKKYEIHISTLILARNNGSFKKTTSYDFIKEHTY